MVFYLPFDLARERATLFLFLVYQYVLFEVGSASKLLMTMNALEGLLARVTSLVPD